MSNVFDQYSAYELRRIIENMTYGYKDENDHEMLEFNP